MSEKWFDDEEIKSIMGEEPEEETESESGLSDELLAELLSDAKEAKPEKQKASAASGTGSGQNSLFYETPEREVDVQAFGLGELSDDESFSALPFNFETLYNIPLEIRVILASRYMLVGEILELKTGDIVKLDKMAGEPVMVLIGDQLIAKGETVVIHDRFGVQITEIVPPRERIRIVEKKLRS